MSSSSSTISSIKVASTIGLGLVAGFALSSPLQSTPTIYALSTRKNAPSLTRSQLTSSRILSSSTGLVAVLLSGVYSMSGTRARHPYLLYAAALALLTTASIEGLVVPKVQRIATFDADATNGEELAHEYEGLVQLGYLSSATSVLAFAISVIGNYGDLF